MNRPRLEFFRQKIQSGHRLAFRRDVGKRSGVRFPQTRQTVGVFQSSEAWGGIEPPHGSFADFSVTTSPPGHQLHSHADSDLPEQILLPKFARASHLSTWPFFIPPFLKEVADRSEDLKSLPLAGTPFKKGRMSEIQYRITETFSRPSAKASQCAGGFFLRGQSQR